jgi:hypothetical protein
MSACTALTPLRFLSWYRRNTAVESSAVIEAGIGTLPLAID